MANFDVVTSDILRISGTNPANQQKIASLVTRCDVSLTMDGASEVSFEVIDPSFQYAEANTWQIRRDVFFRDRSFEIAAQEVQASMGYDPAISLQCRNKNVQLMKRDKEPEAYTRISGTAFAAQVAERYGMNFFGEQTPERQTIVKASNARNDESVWDVLRRAAADQQFVVFETDNTLFFTSMEYLLGKWGDPVYQYEGRAFIPIGWPGNDDSVFPGSSSRWVLMDMPSVRRSDDDPMHAEGSLIIEKTNGVELRPGMTIYLYGIPDFEDYYLITDVEWEEGTPDPVRISFRTPVPYEPRQGAGGGGGSQPTSSPIAYLPGSIVNKLSTFIRRNIKKDTRNFDSRELNSIPLAFDRAVEYALGICTDWARQVYVAGTRDEKDRLLEVLADKYGRLSVMYLALVHVKSDLYARLDGVSTEQLEAGYAGGTKFIGNARQKLIYDKMYEYLSGRLKLPDTGMSSVFTAVFNGAKVDSMLVYRQTTRSAQEEAMQRFEDRYGESSVSYQVLEAVRPYIVYRPTIEGLDAILASLPGAP